MFESTCVHLELSSLFEKAQIYKRRYFRMEFVYYATEFHIQKRRTKFIYQKYKA